TGAKRVTGLVAEDAENAGLEMFVEYNSDGEVEGLQDNRLLTLLIPISKDHDDTLKNHDEKLNDHDTKLEHILAELKQLKEENEKLKFEVLKLKGGESND